MADGDLNVNIMSIVIFRCSVFCFLVLRPCPSFTSTTVSSFDSATQPVARLAHRDASRFFGLAHFLDSSSPLLTRS